LAESAYSVIKTRTEADKDKPMSYKANLLLQVLLAATVTISGCRDSAKDRQKQQMVLNHALFTKITSLDPGSIRDVYSITVVSQICESLYQYHFLKRPYEIIPLLAEGMPEISEDKLTYTIRIKKAVLFQDDKCFPHGKGRELVADDFIYAIKRIANIKYLSQNWAIFDDKIVGLDKFRQYTRTCRSEAEVDYSRKVEGLQAGDDYTLIIKLKRPWPQFVAGALADHTTATGPFILKQWRRGSYVELVRNPGFRGEAYPSRGQAGDAEAGYLDDAGKTMPFADKVIWTIIEEYQPAWFLFLQGKLDGSPIPKDNYNEVFTETRELTDKIKQLKIQFKKFLDPSTFWVGFNMQDPLLGGNKPLRLAINRGINREKFIELFFNGRHLVADGFIPPLIDSYDPNIREKGYARYDIEEARELLRAAEKAHGGKIPELKIAVPGTDTWSRQYGQFLQRQLNNIGLEVEIEYMDWPTYQEKVNTRSAQIFTAGVSASITDAEDFLGLFYSRDFAPGPNKFNYRNDEFDKLYEEVRVMFDSPERRRLYRKMEITVLEDCPAAFLNHRVAYVLHHNWYKNYKPHAFAYGLSKYRRIDLKERAAYKELLKNVK